MKHSIVILLTVIVSFAGFRSGIAQVKKPAGAGHPKEVVRLLAGWNSHDPDKVAAAFTEDGVYEDVTAEQVLRGRSEIRKGADGAIRVYGNFKMEAVSSSYHNGRGVTEWVLSATDKGWYKTGKSFSVRGVSVYELHKGKISSYKEYYDSAAIMKQIGLLMPTVNQ